MAWFKSGQDHHFVYLLCDESEVPIYVGYTNNPSRRIAEHRMEKPWFHEVETVCIYRFATRREALKEEAMGIRFGERLYNKAIHSGIFSEAFEDANNGIQYPSLETYENIPVERF